MKLFFIVCLFSSYIVPANSTENRQLLVGDTDDAVQFPFPEVLSIRDSFRNTMDTIKMNALLGDNVSQRVYEYVWAKVDGKPGGELTAEMITKMKNSNISDECGSIREEFKIAMSASELERHFTDIYEGM